MRFLLAILLVATFSVACETEEPEPFLPEEEVELISETVLGNLVEIRESITTTAGPLAQKALEYEAGIRLGTLYYGPDTTLNLRECVQKQSGCSECLNTFP